MTDGYDVVRALGTAWRAHVTLLAVTGQRLSQPPKETDVKVTMIHNPIEVLRNLLDFFNGEPCRWENGHAGPECAEHMSGMVDGLCTVVAARETLAALESAGLLIIPEAAVAASAGSEPPEEPALAEQLSLADLWEVLDTDKFEVLKPVMSQATSHSLAGRAMARRVVEAAVDRYANGNDR